MGYDLRALVAKRLISYPKLVALIPEQAMYQRSGMLKEAPPTERPFLIYHFGTELTERGVESQDRRPTRRTVQVWVHDTIGDYYRIDQALDEVRDALVAAPSESSFLELRFIERSPDFLDPELHTITRWSRFTATLTE